MPDIQSVRALLPLQSGLVNQQLDLYHRLKDTFMRLLQGASYWPGASLTQCHGKGPLALPGVKYQNYHLILKGSFWFFLVLFFSFF